MACSSFVWLVVAIAIFLVIYAKYESGESYESYRYNECDYDNEGYCGKCYANVPWALTYDGRYVNLA